MADRGDSDLPLEGPLQSPEDEPLLTARGERAGPEDWQEEREEPQLFDLNGEAFDDIPPEKRRLGMTSTVFLIFNRIVGTSIFATPSVILRASGSIGLLLVIWVLGATIAMCGTAVFVELGTGLPKNGGEKIYLEFIYRHPRFLVTCVYAMYAMFIGWEATSSVIFGEYGLHALNPSATPAPAATRIAGVICITFAFLLHGTRPNWGIRVQNVLGIFKLLVLIVIIASGLAVLLRVPGFKLPNPPQNFEWDRMWEGTLTGGVSAFVTGLSTVVWSFTGYTNANYALSEIRDPVRTMQIAAPVAIIGTSVAYFLVNVAYFAVVDKAEVLGSGRIVAALFFGKIFGVWAESVLSAIVSMSALANVLAVLFTHGRVVQELGREGILPFSSFFASSKPFNAPFTGLFEQWFITCLLVITVPPGDAYLFMLNMIAYPFALINMFVAAGLLFLHWPWRLRVHEQFHWDPPFRTPTVVVLLFFLSSVFLVAAPLVPPAQGFKVYERLPYWLHVLVSSSISLLGVAYWFAYFVWLPRRGGYALVREWIRGEDGMPRKVVKRVKMLPTRDSERVD